MTLISVYKQEENALNIKLSAPSLITAGALVLGSLTTHTAIAETTNPRAAYNEPTRGFFIEHGGVSGAGKASVELHTGADEVEAGGGIRLGLENSELLINSGLSAYDGNELLFKWGLNNVVRQSSQSNADFEFAALVGVSHTDNENLVTGQPTTDQTNVKLGVAATVHVDAATFTLTPELVYVDGNIKEDTFVDVGVGAYVGVIDTHSGLFSLGAEALFTTEDDVDHSYALGGRWAYNERVNIDFVPFVFSDGDRIGFPGLVRLNVGL